MKRLLFTAACVLGLAAPVNAASLDPIALYTFDNGIGTDDSGNGNTGIAHAGTGLGTSFNGSNALALTPSGGTSGLETNININRSAMPSMSMGGWVFALSQGTGPGGKFLSHDNGAYGRTLGIDIRGDAPGYDVTAFGGGGTQVVDAVNPASPFGSWMHLAVVYDGANSGLYINGVLDSAFVDTTSTQPGLTPGLFIGTNNYFNEDFHGFVDDVFVFDRALSAAEISSIHANGFDAPAPVPLPAGLPLLIGGLAGLSLLRRRKTQAR